MYKAMVAALISSCPILFGQTARPPVQNAEYEALQAHFERVVSRRSDRQFDGITSVPAWEARKNQVRAELVKMLWHNQKLPSGSPAATITGRLDFPRYTIENLVIKSAPKLYITANLYLPKSGARPFPSILYQCGHASKTYFTRHGAWFASHGIAVLIMDNIEMGEVEFTHHGVYSNAWFHWYSRGFSPLAVELWNARRAVDYLAARADLDPKRIGATGRSGGGMTTFFLAAIDERIKASAPVSGAISSTGWVKQRLSFAHCDCQYPVNSYGMLYSEAGALIAPRAQLLANADADPGFPMDIFNALAGRMRTVYDLYGAGAALRTAVAPGGHNDTEAIRLPVYSFFLKEFLGNDGGLTSEGPVDLPPLPALTCFRNGLPLDEVLTRIDETLIPLAASTNSASPARAASLPAQLRSEVFRYFPSEPAPFDTAWLEKITLQGRTVQKVSFTAFDGLRVKATYSLPAAAAPDGRLPALLIADHRKGIPVWGNQQPWERIEWGNRAVLLVETLDQGSRSLERNLRSFADNDALHHMKRQAMVAGTTIESMQVYELMRSLEFLRTLPDIDPSRISITGKSEMGINAMYAAFLDGKQARVILHSPTASHRLGPHYLGVLRYTDIPEVAALTRARVYGEKPATIPSAAMCSSLSDCLER